MLNQNLLERHTHALAMDQIVQFVEPLKQFSKDSVRLVKRCTKPDRKGEDALQVFRVFVIINNSFTNASYKKYTNAY